MTKQERQSALTACEMAIIHMIDLSIAVEDLADAVESLTLQCDIPSALAAHRAISDARTSGLTPAAASPGSARVLPSRISRG